MSFLTRRDFLKAVGVASFATISSSCSSSSWLTLDYSDTIADTRRLINKKMLEDNVPGLSIALVDGQRIVWAEGFGVAEVNSIRGVDAETIFEIGSISKTFTGFMIMQLVGQGRVNLDDDIKRYIPDFTMPHPAGNYNTQTEKITVRSLMTHLSGIPGDLLNGAFAYSYYPNFNRRLLDNVAKTNATAPVNFKWNYSNTAVSLLADVIESASGLSFKDYSARLISDIGMKDASFFRDSIINRQRIASGHWDGKPVGTIYINIPASGSILASANDMAEYLKMIIGRGRVGNKILLKEELFDLMMTRQNGNVPLDFDFSAGLIWILSDSDMGDAGRVWWHNGSTNTFNSHLEILADHSLGVVALGNSDSAENTVAEVARYALKSAYKTKKGRDIVVPKPDYSPIIDIGSSQLEELSGIYVQNRGYIKMTVKEKSLQMTVITASEEKSGIIVPRANGYFSKSDNQDNQYAFPVVSGRRLIMVYSQGFRNALAEKYDPVTIPQSWRDRCGSYRMINIDPQDALYALAGERYLEASIYIKDGMLIFSAHESIFVLEPLDDSICLMRGFARGQGSTLRVSRSTESGESLWYFDRQYARA